MSAKINSKSYSIGIDIGGTKMLAILWNGEKAIADYELATPLDNLEHFLIMAKALADPLLERAKKDKVKVVGAGLGIAGVLDSTGRKMLRSPNIPIIDGVFLADKLAEFIGLPVVMDNDADCFTRAEALVGAGKGYNSVYGITIGTGVGGGWWSEGKTNRGAHGIASEPGSMIIDFTNMMTVETAYQKLSQNNPGKMAQEAYRGDILAEKAYSEMGKIFGAALANIVNIVDPDIFVLGGGVIGASDLFFSELKNTMKKYIESSEAVKKIKVVKAKLGVNAGAIGAALLVG
jgi:predicted NBD/HSP70 family sugar kinase